MSAAVVEFPAPEPWPSELFDGFGLADLLRLQTDLAEEINRRAPATASRAVRGCPQGGQTSNGSHD